MYRPRFTAHEENAFCVCFATQDIHHLLCGLMQDYRSVPLNIFEPVLLSALVLVIRERSPKPLDLNEVHSLADLLDILSDTELYADDFDLLINMLPLPVFAMLLSQYPNDDFLDRESEQLLFAALQKRNQRLSVCEKQQIEPMINALQHEEK